MRSDIIALCIVIAFVVIWVTALFKAGEKVADQEIRKLTKRFDAGQLPASTKSTGDSKPNIASGHGDWVLATYT
jgi:hypothetical protein